MLRYGAVIGVACFWLLTVACAAPAPPDTREADVKTVKDLEVAWSRDAGMKDAVVIVGATAIIPASASPAMATASPTAVSARNLCRADNSANSSSDNVSRSLMGIFDFRFLIADL